MLDQGSALGDISHADNASDWNATRMRWFVVGIGNTGEVGLVVASIVIEVREDGIVVRERLRRRVVVRHREGGWRTWNRPRSDSIRALHKTFQDTGPARQSNSIFEFRNYRVKCPPVWCLQRSPGSE